MAAKEVIRKRMKRREVPAGIRFVTCSCQGRLPLFSNAQICGVFVEALIAARRKYKFELYAWVLMPEHVHMMVRPNDEVALDRVLLSMKLSVAMKVIARWTEMRAPILARLDDGGGSPRFWQKGGGFDRNVRDGSELCREIRYIHRNPVERGLVSRPEEWKWSSVRWWMGKRDGEVECDPPPGDPRSWNRWKGYL
ncbi:MAG: transposase [Phycisphaerales bacterium]|nr:transposase [Phycisphaerales bacterium]